VTWQYPIGGEVTGGRQVATVRLCAYYGEKQAVAMRLEILAGRLGK
jgi:hypothetical protein